MFNKQQRVDLLTGIKAVLTTKGWCQGSAAKDKVGHYISTFDDGACSFCLLGAARRYSGGTEPYYEMFDALTQELQAYAGVEEGAMVAWWNDNPTRKYEDVIAFLDARIAANNEVRA